MTLDNSHVLCSLPGNCCCCRRRLLAALFFFQERYDFGEAGRLLYDFVWSEYADWYIEAAKARLYSEDATAAAQVGGQCKT